MAHPASVSVVIFTRDEAANLAESLDGVLAQLQPGDEIVVVDAASRDGTGSILDRYAERHPGTVRAHAFPVPVTLGEARATAVEMARHDVLVFVSADAIPEEGWLDAMRRKAADADIVYGRQRHAPTKVNVATVARGLRYRRYDQKDALPETFASHVNAAYRRFAFHSLPFGDDMPGAEDQAFARLARLAGLRIAYAPDAVVRHRDVASLASEWRRRLAEGAAQAQLRALLGTPKLHIVWALTVGLLGVAAVVFSSLWLLGLCLLAFFAPAVRRVASPTARGYRAPQRVAGAAVSPVFDLAFVGSYLTRLIRARG